MTTVGASDARMHLYALLKRVSKGEVIRITRRGITVAKLVPTSFGGAVDRRETVRQIRDLRKGATLGKVSLQELIKEGRQ